MTDSGRFPLEEPIDKTTLTRRGALGLVGGGALGLGASTVSAGDGNGVTITGAGGPAPFQIGNSEGTPQTGDVLDDDDLVFDLEPEFPPFVNFEQMKDEYNAGDVIRYLEPHGTESLLGSQRVVVDPQGDPQTWEEFSAVYHPSEGGMAKATIEPASPSGSSGRGAGQDRSRVELEFEGLYPNAYYTVWVVHKVGWHRPLGGNRGTNNTFVTDEDGNGFLEAIDEPAELTLPPGETTDDDEETDPVPITAYPLHELGTSMPPVVEDKTFALVVAYHYDNRFWGPQPGPFFLSHVVMV